MEKSCSVPSCSETFRDHKFGKIKACDAGWFFEKTGESGAQSMYQPGSLSGKRGSFVGEGGINDRKTRLSINLTTEANKKLTRISAEKGISYTEVVHRGLAVLDYIDAVQSRGGKILVEEDGNAREILFF